MVQLTPCGQQHFIPLQFITRLGELQINPDGGNGLVLHLYLVVPQAVQESLIPYVQLVKLYPGHSDE